MSINDEIEISVKEETPEEKEKKVKESKSKKLKKIYYAIFGAFLAVVVIVGAVTIHSAMTYVAGFFTDYSMAPTINKEIYSEKGKLYSYDNLRETDGNVVNYGLIEPKLTRPVFNRFDVVAFRTYEKAYHFTASRIVGLPGETVKLDYDGNLYINGELVRQPIDKEYLELDWSKYPDQPTDQLYFMETLGEGEYYCLKDNRYYYTNDSRMKGPVKYDDIYGKVIAIQGTCTVKGSNFINCSVPLTRYI